VHGDSTAEKLNLNPHPWTKVHGNSTAEKLNLNPKTAGTRCTVTAQQKILI
jgi:hypothetical protein